MRRFSLPLSLALLSLLCACGEDRTTSATDGATGDAIGDSTGDSTGDATADVPDALQGSLLVDPDAEIIEEPTRAQLQYVPGEGAPPPSHVEFYIDDELLSVAEQPPFTAEWLINRGANNGERVARAVAYDADVTRETLERTVTQALPEPGANEWTFVGPSIYDGTFGPWDIVAMPDNRVALAGKRGGRRVQFVLDQAGALAWNNYWQDGEENCVAFDGQDLLYVGEHPDLGEVAHVSTEGEQLELLHVPDVNGNWKTLYGCATHEGALYLAGNYQHYMYLYAGTTPLATFDVGDDFCCSLEYGLALDAHGRITVAGGGRLSMGSQSRRFVAQFDLDGQPRWQDIATPPGSDSIVFRGLSVGPEDDIYVIYGPHAVIREPQTLTLYRYSSDGELLWKYDTNSEMFEDVAVDERGTVYLAAIARVSENRDSFRIYALGPDDELQWMREHKAPMGADISSMHIALGANGELWVAGELWSGGDMWVGRFGI